MHSGSTETGEKQVSFTLGFSPDLKHICSFVCVFALLHKLK